MGVPRPSAPKPTAKALVRSYTPLKLEVQRAAKELIVDDFVDTYFRERPKTIPELRLEDAAIPAPSRGVGPVPPQEPLERSRSPVDEESGIRAFAQIHRDEAIELSIAEHEEDLVALEARLADRDEHIESMQGEMLRLRMELDALRQQRSASSRPPAAPGPSVPIAIARIIDVDSKPPAAPPAAAIASPIVVPDPAPAPASLPPSAVVHAAMAGRRRSTAWIVAATASAIVVVGGLAALALRSPRQAQAPATPVSSAAAAVEAPRPPRGPTENAAAPGASAVPVPSVAPPGSSGPASGSEGTPASGAPAGASDVEEPGLLSFQAHLIVRSNIDAEVVVQGQPVGRTNQTILVRCGPRNVRLRDDRGWRSAGEHVRITCMHAVTVPIDAAP